MTSFAGSGAPPRALLAGTSPLALFDGNPACNFARLLDLDLRWNHITRIPDELGALDGLNRLRVASNRLEHRPTDHAGLLTSLTYLDLSCNRVRHLPPSLGALEVGQLYAIRSLAEDSGEASCRVFLRAHP